MNRTLKHVTKRNGLCRLLRHCEGTAALEFALIVPVAITFLLGIIEMGVMFFVSMTVESAMANSSRLGKTGFTTTGISREETLKNAVASATAGLVDMTKISITYKSYSAFDKIGQPENYIDSNANGTYDAGETYSDINGNGTRDTDMGKVGMGGAGDVVVYKVSYDWPLMTPMISALFPNGKYTISSSTVVKNEPY